MADDAVLDDDDSEMYATVLETKSPIQKQVSVRQRLPDGGELDYQIPMEVEIFI